MENNTKIIHIASELILVGAISFYFNNQIKTLKSDIIDLKTKMENETAANNKHFNNLYSLIDKMGRSLSQLHFQSSEHIQAPPQLGMRKRKPGMQIKTELFQPKKTGSIESPVDDLDDELNDELKELEEEVDESLDFSTSKSKGNRGESLDIETPHVEEYDENNENTQFKRTETASILKKK